MLFLRKEAYKYIKPYTPLQKSPQKEIPFQQSNV